MLVSLWVLMVCWTANTAVDGLQCKSETGEDVDWFLVYKVPKLEDSSVDQLTTGFGYTYITAKSLKTTADWILSTKLIKDKDSIFGQTVSPLIKSVGQQSSQVSYVAYNDQMSSSSSGAHSKGLVATDGSTGFWLSHSVPHFVPLDKPYDYPASGEHNGQTALCISLDGKDTQNLNKIAYQLLVMRPHIYDKYITDDLVSLSDAWDMLNRKKWLKNTTQNQVIINSIKGIKFTSFSKSSKFEDDLYSAFIAPYFQEDLLVQSWRNGAGGKLSSDCKDQYTVQNVKEIQIQDISQSQVDWKYTEDHSKWTITSDSSGQAWTCITDINRMKSQFKRGGGGLCMPSAAVWKIFKKTAEGIEGCPSRSGSDTSNYKSG